MPNIRSVEALPHTAFTTSGRAAIYQALLQLKPPAGSLVLVPTYHCPTMVAPVLLAQLQVSYFGLLPNGLPNLDTINPAILDKCKAILVPHYFGLAQSLNKVRQWCDGHGIALIEDCAHCYFGEAGERAVGAWGDFATASLSKFFPVPEAGLLASAHRAITPLQLENPSLKAQLKGWLDVMELASSYQRLRGVSALLAPFFRFKNFRAQTSNAQEAEAQPVASTMMRDCDMSRIQQTPLSAAMALKATLPRGRIIARRQQNFANYAAHFVDVPGARPLFPYNPNSVGSTAPYVFPLWVDEPDEIYQALRLLKLPVFRWDRIWPSTPTLPQDVGPLWSHHVLQLLCHQDLSSEDIDHTAEMLLRLLKAQRSTLHPAEA
ncbi:DegT/DnrJ/EryC1/StrS family aminotransferase [Rhodoferax sp. OV413]|uniref:DegT/DnrJ/EryC1/StrS family aminotransferase n=1 Tax=Rhodoferax sp. OV413 TaxID=1855285 RepID=UPI0015A157AD|nr:DegT/DnrJ/EryC1/StrS family aminotransferase [Rhodoferax sp. OV413]